MEVIMIYCGDVYRRILDFTKYYLQGNTERHEVVVRLHRKTENAKTAPPIELKVSINPTEALNVRTFVRDFKKVRLEFSDSFADNAYKSLEGSKSNLFSAGGQLFLEDEGIHFVWPFTMDDLRILASTRIVGDEIIIAVAQEGKSDDKRGNLTLKGRVNELIFVAE